MKGILSLGALISLVIGFLVLVIWAAPAISSVILGAPSSDPNAQSLMVFIVPALFGMLIVCAFLYATDRRPPGLWGE